MLDRRKAQRMPVFLCGIINFSDGQASVKCLIRNRSEGGALLAVDNSNTIPDEFDLVIPQQELTLRAHTRWRGYDHVGVEFSHEDEAAPGVNGTGRTKSF